MKMFGRGLVLGAVVGMGIADAAGSFKYVGVGAPVKHNDDSNIGKFINLSTPEQYAHATFNIANKFPTAKPWIHWGVGGWREQNDAFTDEQHEPYLKHLNDLGVEIWLALRPAGRNAVDLAKTYLGKYGKFQNVVGVSVDMEFYTSINTNAKLIDDAIKAINPKYRLMIKGYLDGHFPTYRGKGDLFFIRTNSENPIPQLVTWHTDFCNKVGKETPPVACGGQIGYPNDEKNGRHHVTGLTYNGWISLTPDPFTGWAKMFTDKIQNADQELGFDWLTVTSSVNPTWDITKGATINVFKSKMPRAQYLKVDRTPQGLSIKLANGSTEMIPVVSDIMGRTQAGGFASGRYFVKLGAQSALGITTID